MGFDNPFLQVSLLIIPLLLLASLALLVVLVRSWKGVIKRDLKRTQRDIRRIRATVRSASLELSAFSPDDPEPYRSFCAALQAQISKVEGQNKDLERGYIALQERLRVVDKRSLTTALTQPHMWYSLHRDMECLREDVSQTQKSLDFLRSRESALQQVAWRTAEQVRFVNQYIDEVRRAFEQLQAKNMAGDALDAGFRELEGFQGRINQLPVYFLAADKEAVIEAADRETIVRAHEIALDTRSRLESLYAHTRQWDEGYSHLRELNNQMQSAVSELEQVISSMPTGLVLSQERAQFEGSKVISQNLNAAVSRPDVEDIEELEKEAEHITRSSREMSARLAKTRQQYDQLATQLDTLTSALSTTSNKMTALETNPIYPLAWGKSAAAVTGMKSRLAEMGGIEQPRTARQVNADLDQCQKLNRSQAGLSNYVDAIEQEHKELEDIYSAAEFQDIETWLQAAHRQAAQIRVYSPENWSRADAAGDLPGDLKELEKEMLRLVPDSVPQPVLEIELESLLEDSRRLKTSFHNMRGRLSRMTARLAEIQEDEGTASQLLEAGFTTLNQIKYLIRSNAYLTRIAAGECERLLSELDGLRAALESRDKDTVERKAGRIESAGAKIEKSVSGWSVQLNERIKQEINEISTSVKTLDSFAYLDENAIVDARQLLSSRDIRASLQDENGKGSLPLSELPNQIKKRNDIWQTATAARSALQHVERPVMESYQEADANRQAVTKLYKAFSKTVKSPGGWPPTSVESEPIRREYEAVEKDWKSIKNEQMRAIALVARLGNLSIRYQRLAVDLERETQRAQVESARIKELETELSALSKAWSNNRKTFRENELAAGGIRELVEGAKVEYARIKRDYREISVPYDQASQELASLVSRLRSAQVRVDDENLLDVDGNLIPGR